MARVNNVELERQQAVIIGLEPKLYHGALRGSFQEISSVPDWKNRVTPNGNNILHVYVGKPLYRGSKCRLTPEKRINMKFVSKVLDVDKVGSSSGIEEYPLLWTKNVKGDTPLHLAATFGHVDVVKEFLDRLKRGSPEADYGEVAVKQMLRMRNNKRDTPLHGAARAGNVEVVKQLVDADNHVLPYQPNKMLETPLYLAVESGSIASVAKILDTYNESSLKLSERGPCGRSPLHVAVHCGNTEMVQMILDSPKLNLLRVQDVMGWTPIHYAVASEFRNFLILKKLLDYDKQQRINESSALYIQDNKGRTSLHIAILEDNSNAIENIVTYCPDCVEIADTRGQTAVHYAAKSPWFGTFITKFLSLVHMENLLDVKDGDGNTPLHILAASNLNNSSNWGGLFDLRRFKYWRTKNLKVGDIIGSNDVNVLINKYKMDRQVQGEKRVYTFAKDVDHAEKAMEVSAAKLESQKKVSRVGVVVAALITTVSFTSALTLPSTYKINMNNADLAENPYVVIFMAADIVAFILSIVSITLYFILPMVHSTKKSSQLFYIAHYCTLISVETLAITLLSGVFAVASKSIGLLILLILFFVGFLFLLVHFLNIFNLRNRPVRRMPPRI